MTDFDFDILTLMKKKIGVMKNSTIFATTKPITYMIHTQSDTYNALIMKGVLPHLSRYVG